MSNLRALPMSLENRRRAVYTALIEFLNEDALWEALTLWEDNYSADAAFSVQKFLSEILDTPALRAQRVRILQTMVKMLSAPPASLLPDPREQLLVHRMRRGKAASSAANSRDPVVGACASLLHRILRGLDTDTRLKMRLFLLERLERSGIPLATRTAVQAWLSEQTRLTLGGAGPGEMQRLLNLAYMGLCEYIGPVAADAALSRALKQLGEEEPHLLEHARGLL
ncbi:MAG: hypothetical protein ACOY3X_00645 [Pseudomonadota bacterium]